MNKTITKADLVNSVAIRAKIDPKTAKEAVSAFLDSVRENLQSGNEIQIRLYFSLKPIIQKMRKARNITKNTEVIIPERASVKFVRHFDVGKIN